MTDLVRFSVSMDRALVERFDHQVAEKGYSSRSEAVRDLIRSSLVQERWESEDTDAVGAITLVYDHSRAGLPEVLTETQHDSCDRIVASMHVHLDQHNCLEILAVRGRSGDLGALADRLISTKGVKHGALVRTSGGADLR
jgi:CopG family nickel-responsive transcriptional regulator